MIIRRRHTANYTTIGNVLFEDERLAADEVGILAFLLSRPHDWEVRRPALMRRWKIGIVAIRRIVRSWMRTGWCHAKKVRLPNGTFYIVYEIRDQPGEGLTDEQIREALSLVSSDASEDDSRSDDTADQPHETDRPPIGDRQVDDQGVATDGWPIKDNTNKGLTKDDSYQKAEREAQRLKEKHARLLPDFKRRWPTAASDDQARIDEAWFALDTDAEEGQAALEGIVPFLAKLKADKRTTIPAGWKYLREKRWALLERAAIAPAGSAYYQKDSPEAAAVLTLHRLAGRLEFCLKVFRRPDGSVSFPKPMTAQLLALSKAPLPDEWPELARNGAGAWEGLLRQFFDVGLVRHHLKEGDRAPWPFPPSIEGKIYTTGPPGEPLMTEQDYADMK